MLGRPKKDRTQLEIVTDAVLLEMETYGPMDPAYPELLNQLERLNALQEKKKQHVSPDTVVLVLGNLLGIVIIVAYERAHVMTSKGMNFILKTK